MPSNWIIMEALTIWRKSKRKYVNEVPSNRIKDEVKACQGMKLLVSRRIFNWGGPGPTHLWPWKETQGKAFQIQIGLFLGGFICILLLGDGIISRSYSHQKARFHIQGQDNKAVVVDVHCTLCRLETCRDRRDRWSCKFFVSCVIFSRKQRSFLHIL